MVSPCGIYLSRCWNKDLHSWKAAGQQDVSQPVVVFFNLFFISPFSSYFSSLTCTLVSWILFWVMLKCLLAKKKNPAEEKLTGILEAISLKWI